MTVWLYSLVLCTLQLIHSWQGNFKAWSRIIWKFWLHCCDCYHGMCSIMTTRTNSVEIHLDGEDISILDFPLPATAHFDSFWQYAMSCNVSVNRGES